MNDEKFTDKDIEELFKRVLALEKVVFPKGDDNKPANPPVHNDGCGLCGATRGHFSRCRALMR